ncbi:MAG: peptidoglycan-binding protein [Synechococcales cyanobacterium RM1_1_8]|nr:peptidoglycan-binding protein [Synechococcales cyanobacterium RM1_1_8]
MAIAPMLLSPLSAQAQSSQTITIQRSLRLGDRGPDVLQLQRALADRGLLDINIPRNAQAGYFGPTTQDALLAFQRAEPGLQADGVLGEATFRRLFAIGLTPTQAYSIALMQAQLAELGYYRSGLDGQFGPATQQALQNLRDEAFVALDPRESSLENTFDVVSGYYNQRRINQDLPHPDKLEERVQRQVPESQLWSYGGWGSGPVRATSQSVSLGSSSGDGATYQVIVPLASGDTEFTALQRLLGSVTLAQNSLGRYAQVGSYVGRRTAEDVVAYLRAEGFDARVIYE